MPRCWLTSLPEVLRIANVLAPIGARAALVDLPHRNVRHEAVRRCAVPVPLAGRRINHVAWTDLDNFTAAGLHQAVTLTHVQRLAAWMSVPGRASPRSEPHYVAAHAPKISVAN